MRKGNSRKAATGSTVGLSQDRIFCARQKNGSGQLLFYFRSSGPECWCIILNAHPAN